MTGPDIGVANSVAAAYQLRRAANLGEEVLGVTLIALVQFLAAFRKVPTSDEA